MNEALGGRGETAVCKILLCRGCQRGKLDWNLGHVQGECVKKMGCNWERVLLGKECEATEI